MAALSDGMPSSDGLGEHGRYSCTDDDQARSLHIEAKCWGNAIAKWNKSLEMDKHRLNKYAVRPEDSTRTGAAAVTSEALIDKATRAQEEAERNHEKRRRSKFGNIARCLQENSRAINSVIQHGPGMSSLVWGGVGMLLQASADNKQASEVIADGLLIIVQQAARWRTIAGIHGHRQTVEDALTNLYFYILAFLQPAIHRFQKRPLARLRISFIRNETESFTTALSKLKDAANELDKIAQWEHNEQLHQNTTALLRSTKERSEDDNRICDWIYSLAHPIAGRPDPLLVGADRPWLLRHRKFQAWLDCVSHTASCLFVCGEPGCGKSHLAQVITDHLALKPQSSASILTHAFQASASAQERSPISLAASILDRLLESSSATASPTQRDAFRELKRLHSRYKTNPEDCNFEPAWEVCVKLLRERNDFILVIDALDECAFRQPQEAESFLKSLHDLLSSTAGKAIIFTRPSLQFDVGLASSPRQDEIVITPEETLTDLNNFITGACSQLHLPIPTRLQVIERATTGANGSFQWVKLFLDEVKKAHDLKQVQSLLRDFPPTCWGFYLELWRKQLEKHSTPSDRETSRGILLVLLGARRRMTIKEVEEALDIFNKRGPFVMSQFCHPLVVAMDGCVYLGHASVRDFLLNEDPKTKAEGLTFDRTEPDADLARKCLECLLGTQYADLDRIARRLRTNIGAERVTEDPGSSFYNYAARYWHVHLTELASPDRDLVKLAGTFLRSLQFAYWAEYSYTDSADFQAIRSTLIRLTRWTKNLPDELKELLTLEAYFEWPYTKLNHEYKESNSDKQLQWLALMQLGFYYFDTGQISKMGKVRDDVADGLSSFLGPLNPLSLKARSDAAYAPLFKGEIRKAHTIYFEVAEDWRRVDPEDKELFFTLVYQGRAEYMMNSPSKALDTISTAMDGFLRTSGPKSNGYLMAVIWYAHVSASPGNMQTSIKELEGVCKTREEQYGPDDAFVMSVRLHMGNLYRICGEHDKALSNIKPAVEFRRQFLPISDLGAADPSIFLAVAYRDAGMYEEADELVGELETNGMLEDKDRFLRLCQVKHLRSLILFDEGETDNAIELLQGLLIDTDREHINRALTWARLDLASMLRYRDAPGDDQAASSLFDNVVEDKRGEDSDEELDPGEKLDPPRLLSFAEKALGLVRSGKLDEAESLLQHEDLQWVRERDLWLNPGMPGADTTWMKPPRGLGSSDGEATGWVNIDRKP